MLNISLCAYLPSICLFWWCVCSNLSIIFYWVAFILLLILRDFIYSGYKSFIKYLICQYFFVVCGLSFNYPSSVFWRVYVFNFDEIQFIDLFFLCGLWILVSLSKKILSNARSQSFYHMFSSRSFIVLGLVSYSFRSMNHSELIITCVEIWIKVLPLLLLLLLFCIWQSSCFSTVCWKDYPFSTNCLFTFFRNAYVYDSISEFFILFHWSVCLSFHQYHVSWLP